MIIQDTILLIEMKESYRINDNIQAPISQLIILDLLGMKMKAIMCLKRETKS